MGLFLKALDDGPSKPGVAGSSPAGRANLARSIPVTWVTVYSPPITTVPSNFGSRIIGLRRRLRISQAEFARRIGAANKTVIYQWESRKRTPSIVFWSRIEQLAT